MDQSIKKLIDSLDELLKTIDNSSFSDNSFDQQHGWNQVHLTRSDVSYVVSNFMSRLRAYGDAKISEGLTKTISSHISNLNRLNTTAKTYFTNNPSHLLHMVPSILLTLYSVISDVDYELFSYQNIQDKKLLPRALATRLRSTESRIDDLSESAETLEEKIQIINDAHEAAESLPTDMASLKEAKKRLEEIINQAKKELSDSKTYLEELTESSYKLNSRIEDAHSQAYSTLEIIETLDKQATLLVSQCDDALQITTTQGLAAGFDQKAKELKKSIWVWIIGLLIALVSGAYIGADRIDAFTEALNSQLTAGQAILYTIMIVLSVGGPLWLAWISTQQINQRFKLSEDYSYKATVAKSFTGFRKFAERFDSETEERLFNSTLDRFDEMPLRLLEGKDYNSPWHEFIDSESFKSAIETFPSLATEAGKFANRVAFKNKPKKNKKTTSTENKQAEAEMPE